MNTLRGTFFWCGAAGVALTVLLVSSGATGAVAPLQEMIDRGGVSRVLASAVLAVTFWVLAMLWVRLVHNGREAAALSRYGRATGYGRPAGTSDMQRLLQQAAEDAQRQDPERAEALVAGRSAVHAARSETPYALIRALVWALPALGFIGTAAEMARSIGGLGGAVARTSSYAELSHTLVRDVIPPLAGAFSITLFALGSSVVCHLLVSMVHTHEERLLLKADERALTQLRSGARAAPRPDWSAESRAAEEMGTAMRTAVAAMKDLNTELGRLRTEAARTRLGGEERPDRSEEIVRQLSSIGTQLSAIGAGLDRDMVLTPVRIPRGGTPDGRTILPGDDGDFGNGPAGPGGPAGPRGPQDFRGGPGGFGGGRVNGGL
ncbi:hypothetical protein [Streptomyces olivaceiscleroticus]|uniref:MotA/TolQ/ExbB proton channel domain-containing protein n=1 Tax=Streptomyces olivaceiscleroticus TaxID=68245 RepID=A0ABN1AN25_9ACTN